MTKLNFFYSKDYETERIMSTIKKINWYKENGYKPIFPEGFDIERALNLGDEDLKVYICDLVDKEYKEEDYKLEEERAVRNWSNKGEKAIEEMKNCGLSPIESYDIYFTKYGVGGSYGFPETIIVNIKNKWDIGVFKTLVHEITHLCIQEWIEKYSVSHWRKERLVDLLTTQKIIPGLVTEQPQREDVSIVDESFEKYFPDMEKVIQNIA